VKRQQHPHITEHHESNQEDEDGLEGLQAQEEAREAPNELSSAPDQELSIVRL
jgi:hypothetical protein